jgi:arabinofuranan 3-O-arabinosyltransferase
VIEASSTAQFAVEAVALEPVAAGVGTAAVLPVDVIDWGATSRAVEVGASESLRILETTENANAGWTATWEGKELESVRVDGWRQGWIVPPGAGGFISLEFPAQRLYLGGLLAGLLAAIVLMAMALLGRRGTGADSAGDLVASGKAAAESEAPGGGPSPGPGGRGRWVLAAGGVVIGLLLGGWVGAGVAVIAMAAAWLLNRAAVSGALALAAAGMAALLPWPERLQASDWIVGATALLALGALAATAAPCRAPSDDEPTQGSGAREQTTKH